MRHPSDYVASLDLCRGLAAIGVLLYHIDFMFFGTHGMLLHRGYLCVDFFFLLSGYVIALSYDQRLRDGLSVSSFFLVRVARLWPLVVLTTLLGLVAYLARAHKDLTDIDAPWLLVEFTANIFVLPAFSKLILFPFNPAAWSIFFEMAVNIFYAAVFVYLSGRVILGLVVAGALGLVMAVEVHNSLDVGWGSDNFIFGFPRVVFSFFLGVAIQRSGAWMKLTWVRGPYPLFGGLLTTTLLLSVPPTASSPFDGYYDLGVVTVLFPVLLVIAVSSSLPQGVNQGALLLGGISYSVYLLHTPLMILYSGVPQVVLGQKIATLAPWAGMVFVPALLVTSYLCWVCFERPAQRWLRAGAVRRQGEIMKSTTLNNPSK